MSEPTAIGWHVSRTELRRAVLRRVGARIEVVALEADRFPFAAFETDELRSPTRTPQPVAETRPPRRCADSVAADSTVQTASMPAPDVMTRVLTLPQADEAKFRQMVAHRLEADLPLPLDEVVWGYRRGETDPARGPAVQVLAQAVRRDRVQRLSEVFGAAVGEVGIVTSEAEALWALVQHGLERAGPQAARLLVLATAEEWLVALLADGMVPSVRRIPADGQAAEQVCRQIGQYLAAEQVSIDRAGVLWCATPEIEAARQVLADTLGITVQPAEPAAHLTTPEGAAVGSAELARFGPAIGLALAGLFEPETVIRFGGRQGEPISGPRRERIERILSRPSRWAGLAAALGLVATVVHVGAIAAENRAMQRLLSARDPNASSMAALEPKIRAMQRVEQYRIDVEGVMAELCKHVPDNMVISSIKLAREQGLSISGSSEDPKAVFTLAEAMRKSGRFDNVRPGRTEPGRGGGFTITADLTGVTKLSSLAERGVRWP